tara:strand:+ start:1449 stop:1742 length:294 start_codon:yes stop_codon:yes gene_type:complete
MSTDYLFKVETIEAGQRRSYGDSFYTYKVESNRPEFEVRIFCTKFLKTSYPKNEMPDPFAGEMLEFKKLTDNNKTWKLGEELKTETYSYKVRTEFTG